jgi:Divergent InlB B-repeat domain
MRAVVAALALAGGVALVVAVAVAGRPAEVLTVHTSTATDIQPLASVAAPRALAAWCGQAASADRTPNAVAGNPIHWVYVIPSDGADNLAGVASVMQADADSIDAWWRGQDSTRVPRNDLTSFSCGSQLDITTLRMSRSSSQLAPLQGRFPAIVDALEQARLASSFTKFAVYFDGQTAEENVCGQGGSDSSGFGVAIVYVRSCVGVSTAAVAVHEVVHTLGAVPRGAPHECTDENGGHTCDDERDLMYPSIGGESLSSKLLDPGRDDYYGHSGGWTDTQDSAWLVRLDSQTPLAVTVSGPGSVSADVPGLQCSASCTTTWNAGQRLALTATPSAGAKLVRWGGVCSGAAGCTLSVAAGTAVSAVFAPASFRLAVAVTGKGAIRSSRAGITCRPRCSAAFPSFSPVRLTATPAKGWKLRSWTGACRGAKKTCTVPMSAATSARATFVRA